VEISTRISISIRVFQSWDGSARNNQIQEQGHTDLNIVPTRPASNKSHNFLNYKDVLSKHWGVQRSLLFNPEAHISSCRM